MASSIFFFVAERTARSDASKQGAEARGDPWEETTDANREIGWDLCAVPWVCIARLGASFLGAVVVRRLLAMLVGLTLRYSCGARVAARTPAAWIRTHMQE